MEAAITIIKSAIAGPETARTFENCLPNTLDTRVSDTENAGVDPAEIAKCIRMLATTTGGTGFMHEGFYKDDGANHTRPWFAWSNSSFGELIYHLYLRHPEILKKAEQ